MVTDCLPRPTGLELDGYEVSACLETPDGARRRTWNYGLGADRSGLLYFFDRDNVELLVKVLDGCAINGHRWVFVAPVTDLTFRLAITPLNVVAHGGNSWLYDSDEPVRAGRYWTKPGNAKGQTASTLGDTTAFPCTAAEIAAAKASSENRNEPWFGAADLVSPGGQND